MLIYRALSALVGIPLAVFLVCKGGLWLAVPLCVLAAIGFYEFADKCKLKGVNVIAPLGYLCSVGMVVLSYARVADLLLPDRFGRAALGVVFLLVMGSLVASFFRFHHDQESPVLADVSATVLGSLYLGVTLSFFLLLRDFRSGAEPFVIPGFAWSAQEFGARLLLLVFCATWATDTGAYFAGKNLGKHKLTPASPNKTWEGCVGGFLGAVVIAVGFGAWFGLPLLATAPAGIIVGVMGQFGDLCKSILKRDLGTKDFGALIPGHGGVLDRFDSLMMNVPLVYFYVALVM